MKTAMLIVALIVVEPVDATSQVKTRRNACEAVKAKIRYVESRMRAGYTAKQGIRLEERLRELRRKRSRLCR